MRRASEVVALALAHRGERYVLGARVPYERADWTGPWDCAEFVTWAVYQVTRELHGVTEYGDAYSGAWAAEPEHRVAPEIAAATPGAVLVRAPGGQGRTGHVALSIGYGRTVEAYSSTRGVIEASALDRRWDVGLLLPELVYEVRPAIALSQPRAVWRQGTSGAQVVAIQTRLRELGYDVGPVDGVFGGRTARAVVEYQARVGLVADGEVGPVTASSLGLR